VPATVLSSGSGPVRDLFICFHGCAQTVAANAPDAIVLQENGPAFSGWYQAGPNRGIETYPELLSEAQDAAPDAKIGRVFLVGFSEGGIAVRTLLEEGADPDGVIVADGTYGGLRPAYKNFFDRARANERTAVVSHSSIPTMNYASTHDSLEADTGWTLPQSDTLGEIDRRQEGQFVIHSWGGIDANAHMAHVLQVLPVMIEEARNMAPANSGGLSFGSSTTTGWFAFAAAVVLGFLGWDYLSRN
jgi:hypothetical protein